MKPDAAINGIKAIGAKLRAARQRRQLTQMAAANHLGVSAVAIHYYETGANEPSLVRLQRLCNLYDISVAELIGD